MNNMNTEKCEVTTSICENIIYTKVAIFETCFHLCVHRQLDSGDNGRRI